GDGSRHDSSRDGCAVFDHVSSHECRPALDGKRFAGPEARAGPSELLGHARKARSRAEHHETSILSACHELFGRTLAVPQSAQEILAAAHHFDVPDFRWAGRAHGRIRFRAVRLHAVLRSFCGYSASLPSTMTARLRWSSAAISSRRRRKSDSPVSSTTLRSRTARLPRAWT